MEGQILLKYIDNQARSKISIARDLGISKQALFQYFKSKELEPETKERFEKYFGEKIFDKKDDYTSYRRKMKNENKEDILEDENNGMYKINPFLKDAPKAGSEPIKVMNVDFAGSSGVVFYDDNIEFPSYEMKIPAFSGATGFNVFGRSMEPLIMSGSICFSRN